MESPYFIIIVIRKYSYGDGIVLQLEQELFFPGILCQQMCALRLNKNLQLLISVRLLPLQKQNIVRLKSFAILKRVNVNLAFISDKVNPIINFFQIIDIPSEVGYKYFFR